MFAHSADFVQHLAHLEAAYTTSSWLHGLMADLQWAHEIDPSLPETWQDNLTEAIDHWQQPMRPHWTCRVQRIWRRHLQQEEMMAHAHGLHRSIFKVLTEGGSEFSPPLSSLHSLGTGAPSAATFDCDCGRSFTTAQGLACHRRLAHGHQALETPFLQDATCPWCLRYMWTTNRLRAHLAYIPRDGRPNACFAGLAALGYVTDYQAVDFPTGHRGHSRCDALQAQGPARDPTTAAERETAALLVDLDRWEAELRTDDFRRSMDEGIHLGEALTTYTLTWFDAYLRVDRCLSQVADIADGWLALLMPFEADDDDWATYIFLQWGRHWLPDLQSTFVDGAAEHYVEQSFYELVAALPRYIAEGHVERIQTRLRGLAALPAPRPHRPVYLGPANSRERALHAMVVPRLLHEQTLWQQRLRDIHWQTLPPSAATPMVRIGDADPVYIVVHLFSGRRRIGDFHWHVQRYADEMQLPIVILSLDTAVSPVLGDLSPTSSTWRCLQDLFERGLCSAVMVGSPCETFSSARHNPPPEGVPPDRWPRPLRTYDRLYGLDGLKPREYAQLRAGTSFWLQGLYSAACLLVNGGIWASEHPAPPRDAAHASTWTSALRAHPDLKLDIVYQYKWGATVPKPTGLMGLRLPRLVPDMLVCSDRDAPYPTSVAIGRDEENGQFKTARHKEYPERFCAGLAFAFMSELRRAARDRSVPVRHIEAGSPLVSWLSDLATASKKVRSEVGWLPDFQG
eukprot:Skav221794  [mRNA]  locus=scaffold4067:171547:173760:+ [translate_table: standard]